MTRRISFSATLDQVRARRKWVTRRMGFADLMVGEELTGIEKGQGLRRGERQVVVARVLVVGVRREPLASITQADVIAEGFPDLDTAGFVDLFCKLNKCVPEDVVTRISFRYGLEPLHALRNATDGSGSLVCAELDSALDELDQRPGLKLRPLPIVDVSALVMSADRLIQVSPGPAYEQGLRVVAYLSGRATLLGRQPHPQLGLGLGLDLIEVAA